MVHQSNALCFVANDLYIRLEANEGVVGITSSAARGLRSVTAVELPEKGQTFGKGECFGRVESKKVVIDLLMPVTGEVVAVNTKLVEQPYLVARSCYGEGWIIRISLTDLSEVDSLQSLDDCRAFGSA